jgi:hypothetical protein
LNDRVELILHIFGQVRGTTRGPRRGAHGVSFRDDRSRRVAACCATRFVEPAACTPCPAERAFSDLPPIQSQHETGPRHLPGCCLGTSAFPIMFTGGFPRAAARVVRVSRSVAIQRSLRRLEDAERAPRQRQSSVQSPLKPSQYSADGRTVVRGRKRSLVWRR